MSVRILTNNYVENGTYSDFTASSEATGFGVENLESDKARAKTWRSAGYFAITASNKTIVFRESVGVDLTATIAESNYTTLSSFLTAIKTALDAAGAATYTVTQTAAKKISIASDLGGGATVFQLMCSDVAFTARDVLGFSTSDRTGSSSYTADNVRIHTEEFITIDLGAAFNPKAFILVGPRNEPLRISQSATVKIQGNSTDSWTSPAFEATLTHTDFALARFSTTGLHSSALRYWRVSIVDRDNARGYVEASALYLGDWLTFTRGCPEFPLEIEEIDNTEKRSALQLGTLSTIRSQTAQVTLNWNNLTKTEVESMRDAWADRGLGKPFFVSLDPDEAFSSDLERWVLMVTFDSSPQYALDGPNRFSSTWVLVEEV